MLKHGMIIKSSLTLHL